MTTEPILVHCRRQMLARQSFACLSSRAEVKHHKSGQNDTQDPGHAFVGFPTSWQHAHNQETRGAHPSDTGYRYLVELQRQFPIPAHQCNRNAIPKRLKNALRPRKNVIISTAMCRHVREVTSQKRPAKPKISQSSRRQVSCSTAFFFAMTMNARPGGPTAKRQPSPDLASPWCWLAHCTLCGFP
jgi:hypothetical protein